MSFLSFKLSDDFVAQYQTRPVDWGFPIGGGNYLGEVAFYTKYSRQKSDGSKEQWFECCRRCIEGMYSILKDHCKNNRTPWNENKAQRSAQEAYERMFCFKWLPPGRGLWTMGTELVNVEINSAPLINCAFISTARLSSHSEYEATMPFVRLMEMSMNGIGVGFDLLGAGSLTLHEPTGDPIKFVIPDTREGWCESLHYQLVSYFFKRPPVEFDYSLIRPKGTPLKRFGGYAAGPEPLQRLHDSIDRLLGGREGEKITSLDILDINNLSGKAVVAGGIRRSAELALGNLDDKPFLQAKDYTVYPERNEMETGWGHLSNNSIFYSGQDAIVDVLDQIALQGEPGVFNLELAQRYGRLIDAPNDKDWRVGGVNPCAEVTLESNENCNLNEVFPLRAENLADFKRTMKFAYLYSKAVTLLPTPWPETNEIITRNRRIGASLSGLAQFVERFGWKTLQTWADAAYQEIQSWDRIYSEWLGVRESIKTTSVKPSGTVSLLPGQTPGVHWPEASGQYLRRQRLGRHEPIVEALRRAGYQFEPDVMDPDFTVVTTYPTVGPEMRDQWQVSVWEKVALANLMQRYWADNSVSATFTFAADERGQIGPIIKCMGDQLKTMSFLPMLDSVDESGHPYKQLPYEKTDDATFSKLESKVKPLDWSKLYSEGPEATGERFCTNDRCTI